MITSKKQGSVCSEIGGSVCTEMQGSLWSGQVGSLSTEFPVNRFRVTHRQKKVIEAQKKEVEDQKEVVEEKQKEILDSIHYAKRIQTALMPNEKYIDRNIRALQRKQK